jgi:hypothetical protein
MKIIIKTTNVWQGCKFSRAVLSRENWTAESHSGGMTFAGSGSTIMGRKVEVRVDFGDDGGEASIVLDAPGIQVVFLGTILEDVFGQGVLRRDTEPGVKPTKLPQALEEVYVEIDGQPKGWKCIPCTGEADHPETAKIWWWTVAL